MNKILIVDDSQNNRVVLQKLLERLGDYTLVEACDGSQALIQFEREKPDLILMDINMPIMDGYQTARAIKATMGDIYCPIIFVTAMRTDGYLKKALASGGDDFIRKPVLGEILNSKVKAHLRIRELNRQLYEKNLELQLVNQHLCNEQELIEHFFENSLKHSFLDPKIIQYHMRSMSTFTGDLFLVERGPEGGLFLILGDFTGHGLTASMGTLPVAMTFQKMVTEYANVSDIASEINFQLHKLMPPGMFFAATIINVDASAENMTIWMGGLPDSYWFSEKGKLKGIIQSEHLALGILSETDFSPSTQEFRIDKDDKLYVFSDGIIEARDHHDEMFGEKRLKNLLMNCKDNRFECVLNELTAFTKRSNQSDDIAFVEMTCRSIDAATNGDVVLKRANV